MGAPGKVPVPDSPCSGKLLRFLHPCSSPRTRSFHAPPEMLQDDRPSEEKGKHSVRPPGWNTGLAEARSEFPVSLPFRLVEDSLYLFLDFGIEGFIGLEDILGGIAALGDLGAPEADPRTALLEDIVLEREIEE